jgi:hypothetical protein
MGFSALGRTTIFTNLGVKVLDGEVFSLPGLVRSRSLGPLHGATAEVTDGTNVHRVGAGVAAGVVLGPVGLLAALPKKSRATAFVIFADGSLHEHKLNGNSAVRRAQAECVRFNLAAQHSAPAEPSAPTSVERRAEHMVQVERTRKEFSYHELKPSRDAYKAARRAGMSRDEASAAALAVRNAMRERKSSNNIADVEDSTITAPDK